MMFSPPFFRTPYYRRFLPSYYTTNMPKTPTEKGVVQDFENKKINYKKDSKINSEKREYLSDNSQVFNILGITLHFDDILIICLLFFLYSEGVKDEMLFIALILLLLS